MTVTVTVRDDRRPQLAAVALTVLFVAWVMGWLWWLAAAAALYGAARLGWWAYLRYRTAAVAEVDRRAQIAARADQQHAWRLAGDPRGTFGADYFHTAPMPSAEGL